MKTQTVLLLMVATGCGLVATLGVKHVISKNGEESARKIQVLQAATDINIGEPLNKMNTQFVSVAPEAAPEGAVTDLAQIAERSMKFPASSGDWITVRKLGERGALGAVSIIPPGMQVCTIPVDATTSHSGMLQAGNRVDLLLNYDDLNGQGKKIKKIKRLLQYIEVFAVDNKVYGVNADGESHQAKNVSLLVNPEQAMFLELARTKGRLSTVLRGNGDDEKIANDDMSEDDLRGEGPGVDTRSTVDAQMPGLAPNSIMADLQREFMGTGPVAEPLIEAEPNTWTIAIWEGTDVRLESVNLDSDLPLPTRQTGSVLTAPRGPDLQIPEFDGRPQSKDHADGEPSGALDGLSEAASDLWKLFD